MKPKRSRLGLSNPRVCSSPPPSELPGTTTATHNGPNEPVRSGKSQGDGITKKGM